MLDPNDATVLTLNDAQHLSPDELGLISLYGIVVAPRAAKPWREKPNAGGERRR